MLSWFAGTPEIDKLYIVVRNDATVNTLVNYVQKRGPYLIETVDLFSWLGFKVEYVNIDFEIEVIEAKGWGIRGDLRCAINQITLIDELEEEFLVCCGDYIITRKLPDRGLSPQLDISEKPPINAGVYVISLKKHTNCPLGWSIITCCW